MKALFSNRRVLAFAGILLAWGMLYLPSLSRSDASRNEGRRIIPAITMLETGNWATPMLSGKPYYRKPPMMSWIIAASYKISGVRNILLARLPTALLVLLAASAMLCMPSGVFGFRQRLLASLAFLTSFGMIGLGRTADIDPNYVCCAALAMVFWLDAWSRDRSGWSLWIPPSIPLAVGFMLKGPLILLVYYVFVVAVLYFEKRGKSLLSPWHIFSICLVLAPFIVWSFFFLHKTGAVASAVAHSETSTWYKEIMMRFRFGEISFGKWIGRVAGSFAQFLPWLLFFPLLWRKRVISAFEGKSLVLAKAARFAVPAVLLLIDAMPATKARYSAPLLPIVAIASGMIIPALDIPERWERILVKTLSMATAAVLVLTSLLLIPSVILKFISLDAIKDERKLALASAVDATPIILMLSSLAFAALLFLGYRKYGKRLKGAAALLCATLAVAIVGINAYLVFIQPLTKIPRSHASTTAREIEAFAPVDATVCGVDYVGEEPFVAHLRRKWIMVDRIADLKTSPTVFILDERWLDDLLKYENDRGFSEIGRKTIIYKKRHKYMLVKLERKTSAR